MEREKFKRFAEREREFREKAAMIEKVFPVKEEAQADLDTKALRAETLGESDWKEKRSAASENKKAVESLREELLRIKEGIAILQTEKEKCKSGAIAEIRAEYREKFARALKDVYLKLKAAEAAKVELQKIQAAANREAIAIGILDPVINFQNTGQPNFLAADYAQEFMQRSAMNGYSLE